MPRSHRLTHCTRSISVSLFLPYALMVSLVGLPDPRPARAQTPAQTGDQNTAVRKGSEELPEGKVPRPANAENDSSPKDETLRTPNSKQDGSSDLTKTALSGNERGIEKLPNVAGLIKDLQGRKFSTLGSSLLSGGRGFETARAASQEPRPMPTPPPPGIGRGGTGPGGSFNVEPPARRQEAPEGVRSVTEVLTDTRTARIPDLIPSTQPYCWPGDPECRKVQPSVPKPAPKPTPPPRSVGSNNLAVPRTELLAANTTGYLEQLRRGLAPYELPATQFGELLKLAAGASNEVTDELPRLMIGNNSRPSNSSKSGAVYLGRL